MCRTVLFGFVERQDAGFIERCCHLISFLLFISFQKACHDIFCFRGILYDDGTCETADVCYDVYIRASVVSELMPTVAMTQNRRYVEDLIEQITHSRTHEFQIKLFYHADELNYVDYFILYLIVYRNSEALQVHSNRGLLFRNKTISVVRDAIAISHNIFHDYVLNVESFNVSFNNESGSLHVPSLKKDNTMDVLHEVEQNLTNGSCTRQVVSFNKIRTCPYMEIPLKAYFFSVNKVNLILEDTLSNPTQVFKLFHWEYMIAEEQLRICITDFFRLKGFLPKPMGNGASPFLVTVRHDCYCCINIYIQSIFLIFSTY